VPLRSASAGSRPAGLASVPVTIEPASATSLLSAHTILDQLMAKVGVDGLVTAMRTPGLLALVDQHVAAIRETFTTAGVHLGPVNLARYARSVLTMAERHGFPPHDVDTVDWRQTDWYLIRLVAVCSLADSDGFL